MQANSHGEALLKEILDWIFPNKEYQDNARPKWLQGLELDRYYPGQAIAFEYQGFQHSYFVPKYHKDINDLKAQRQRDDDKKACCRKSKVALVRVYYWQLSVGQVCELIMRSSRKNKRQDLSAHAHQVKPRNSGRLAEREALNAKCLEYKKIVKNNYSTGKWVKKHARSAPPGKRKPKKKAKKDWSAQIARAERELKLAHAELEIGT